MTRRHGVITVSVFGLLLFAMTLLLFSSVANAPSNAFIRIVKNTRLKPPSINLTPVMLTNAYASFDYPTALSQTPYGNLASNEDAAYSFVYHDSTTWKLTIKIITVSSGQLNTNSTFEALKAAPQSYQESQMIVNGQTVQIMNDKNYDGFNKVAFLVSGPYQAIISLSGNDPNGLESIDKTFSMIINSWQWNNG